MNLYDLFAGQLGMLGWVSVCFIVAFVFLNKLRSLFQVEKGLHINLMIRKEELKNIRIKAESTKVRNQYRKAVLDEQLARMNAEICILKRDFKSEIQRSGVEPMLNNYQITLATYARIWQKL